MGRVYGSFRLAPFYVQENARVISAFAPCAGARPIHLALAQRSGRGGRRRFQHEVAFAEEPFVNADATVEPLRAVVRNEEERSFLQVDSFERAGDLAVE